MNYATVLAIGSIALVKLYLAQVGDADTIFRGLDCFKGLFILDFVAVPAGHRSILC